MNNEEIKEILDILKKCKDYDDEVYLIKQHSATLLLDYITNLQTIQEAYDSLLRGNAELENKIIELQQIEKDHQKLNGELREENENNKKAINLFKNDTANMINQALHYKSRIDKAIEYITSEKSIEAFKTIESREEWLKINHKLLNILQGSDKE